MGPDLSDVRQRNLDAVYDMLARFSAGDAEGHLAHIDEEILYEAPFYAGFAPRRGKTEMARMLAAVESRFSSVRYDVVAMFPTTDPDLVIAEVRGDHQVANSPNRYQNHYVMFLTFRAGKVVHWREFSNPDVYRAAAC